MMGWGQPRAQRQQYQQGALEAGEAAAAASGALCPETVRGSENWLERDDQRPLFWYWGQNWALLGHSIAHHLVTHRCNGTAPLVTAPQALVAPS